MRDWSTAAGIDKWSMVIGLSSQFSNWSWSLVFFWPLTMTFDQTSSPDYKPKTYSKCTDLSRF